MIISHQRIYLVIYSDSSIESLPLSSSILTYFLWESCHIFVITYKRTKYWLMFPFNFNSPQCQPQLQKTEVLRWLHSNHQFAYPFLSSMTPGTLAFMLENYREDVLNVTVSIF